MKDRLMSCTPFLRHFGGPTDFECGLENRWSPRILLSLITCEFLLPLPEGREPLQIQ
jgi:hypothetical protein